MKLKTIKGGGERGPYRIRANCMSQMANATRLERYLNDVMATETDSPTAFRKINDALVAGRAPRKKVNGTPQKV